MKKRVLAVVLTLALLIGMVPVTHTRTEAAVTYSVSKAMEYAAANWNKNTDQLCAEFVYNCVKAGGLKISRQTGTGPCLRAIESASGISKEKLNLASNGHATKSVTGNQLAAGDVVIQYCTTCKLYPHIIICAGYGSNGRAVYYGHNAAMNKAEMKLTQNALHKGSSCNVIAYVVRISTLDSGTADSVTFSNIEANPGTYSCRVSFDISYTGTRPTAYGINYGLAESFGFNLISKLNHSYSDTLGGTANPYVVECGMANLEHNTTYCYQPFVIVNGKTIKGEVYNFTTPKDTAEVTVDREFTCGYNITIEPNQEVYVYESATSKDTYKILDPQSEAYTLFATKRIALSDYNVRYYVEDDNGDSYYLRWLTNYVMSSEQIHDLTATVIEPTYTEGGYTLYNCPCGYSDQRDFTTPMPDSSIVPSPTQIVPYPTGSVTNPSMIMLGDVDENGKVEANDALLTLKQVVKLEELTDNQLIAANVVIDGHIKADDALQILKYVVKLIDEF